MAGSARLYLCRRRPMACFVHRGSVVPVRLVWGDKDWARAGERQHDRSLLAGVQTATIENGGHFLPLDRPRELQAVIVRFASP